MKNVTNLTKAFDGILTETPRQISKNCLVWNLCFKFTLNKINYLSTNFYLRKQNILNIYKLLLEPVSSKAWRVCRALGPTIFLTLEVAQRDLKFFLTKTKIL